MKQNQRRTALYGKTSKAKHSRRNLKTFLASTIATMLAPTTTELAYMATLFADPVSGTVDAIHPLCAFKAKGTDPDLPLYHQAMLRPDADKFVEAQGVEIQALEAKDTWEYVLRSDLPKGSNILPGTWAFRVKRYPDNRIKKYKARFCVRGDKQIQGVDVFDTYAPVVGWSTVRMMLTMAACLKWQSVQVDFDAAFVHATLPESEQVYLEMPRDFDAPTTLPEGDYVLKLRKTLYGMKQSPLHWFNKLKNALEHPDLGFKPCMRLLA
jgi:hypothetical protein